MNMITVIVLAIFIVVVVAFALWWSSRRQRTEKLRQHFGPEYDRAVEQYGAEGRAEKELQGRAERVEQLHITPLSPADSSRYAAEWRDVQALFVDDPQVAIGEADRLVGTVMQARGYPMGDFEQRAADISVDHPQLVEHYRAAHSIARSTAGRDADTEELRQAIVHYRALFNELIETPEPARQEVRR
jgi:FtsZ-interacting cell division protein ZipA